MAKKSPGPQKLPVKNAANVRSDNEKLLRALIVLFILMGAAAALIFGLVALRRALFTSNPRFQLREVVVQAEGYWQNRSAQLSSRLGIRLGDMNMQNVLFSKLWLTTSFIVTILLWVARCILISTMTVSPLRPLVECTMEC